MDVMADKERRRRGGGGGWGGRGSEGSEPLGELDRALLQVS